MKITVTSAYDEKYASMGRITSSNHKIYSHMHRYTYVLKNKYFLPNIPISWQKIDLCILLLKETDYLFWIDADAFFLNPSIKIESILSQPYLQEIPFMGTKRIQLPPPNNPFFWNSICSVNGPCMGVFLLRNCTECLDFLNQLVSLRKRFLNGNWENGAVNHLVENAIVDLTKLVFLKQRVMNSSWMQIPGNNFILHLAATHNRDGIAFLNILNPFRSYLEFNAFIRARGLLDFYNEHKNDENEK